MIYAEFYHDSTGWNGKDYSGPVKLIPACGSDAVLVLDGRHSRARQIATAREHVKRLNASLRKDYKGFTINAGDSFTRSSALTGVLAI